MVCVHLAHQGGAAAVNIRYISGPVARAMNIWKYKLNGTKYAEGKRKKKTDTRLLVPKTTIAYLSHPEYKAAVICAQNR